MLDGWGYQLRCGNDTVLPMVACQVLLLRRSLHIEQLTIELFERIRGERLLPDVRLNTSHAMQQAVAELGYCEPPQRMTGPLGTGKRRSAGVGSVGGPLVRHLIAHTPRPQQRPPDLVQGRAVVDAATSGSTAAVEPWQHYDLGHGYCTYTFFE
ncbi:hypothetical protein [Streptomyces sparsogenes]|uniref:Uncharacterized protein n=1 Tax=Streptomyces sparsogenes DSM 40356 TaxID=1331668 RepID=A0A1R1SHL6_9ACTN|nr:hypothetical protein [Streptomyces sparsogenes]OMI37831.1 hypothetical protein SPAR_19103 [Streptomyces sparsogenes DSM 40356]